MRTPIFALLSLSAVFLSFLPFANFSSKGKPGFTSSIGLVSIKPASTAALKTVAPSVVLVKTVDHPSGDPTEPVDTSDHSAT